MSPFAGTKSKCTPDQMGLTRLPYVFPSLTMMPVLIMLRISLVAVPAFMRVLPVTASGPVTAATRYWALPSLATADGSTQTTPTVTPPALRTYSSPPRT